MQWPTFKSLNNALFPPGYVPAMTRGVGDGGGGGGRRPLNTVQFEHPSHTGALLYGLNALRSKGLLLDVTLVAGGEAFQVGAGGESLTLISI